MRQLSIVRLIILTNIILFGFIHQVSASVLLRCEGFSGVKVTGVYTPSVNETCITGRDLCTADIIDFWFVDENRAIPSGLFGKNYKLNESPSPDDVYKTLFFTDAETLNTVSFKPTTGEYYFLGFVGENRMERQGFCEKVKSKKLF